eukprot:55910_1
MSTSQNIRYRFECLIFGYIRELEVSFTWDCGTTPMDIKRLIFEHYPKAERLQFSTEYRSKPGWKITESNQTAWHCEDTDCTRWIAMDMQPMVTGKHAWRTHITNPHGNWLYFGICYPNSMFNNDSYDGDTKSLGLSCNDDFYVNQKDAKYSESVSTNCLRHTGTYEVDVLFDCDKGYFEVTRLDADHAKFFITNINKEKNGYHILQ